MLTTRTTSYGWGITFDDAADHGKETWRDHNGAAVSPVAAIELIRDPAECRQLVEQTAEFFSDVHVTIDFDDEECDLEWLREVWTYWSCQALSLAVAGGIVGGTEAARALAKSRYGRVANLIATEYDDAFSSIGTAEEMFQALADVFLGIADDIDGDE